VAGLDELVVGRSGVCESAQAQIMARPPAQRARGSAGTSRRTAGASLHVRAARAGQSGQVGLAALLARLRAAVLLSDARPASRYAAAQDRTPPGPCDRASRAPRRASPPARRPQQRQPHGSAFSRSAFSAASRSSRSRCRTTPANSPSFAPSACVRFDCRAASGSDQRVESGLRPATRHGGTGGGDGAGTGRGRYPCGRSSVTSRRSRRSGRDAGRTVRRRVVDLAAFDERPVDAVDVVAVAPAGRGRRP
jgi:hypothetical protein